MKTHRVKKEVIHSITLDIFFQEKTLKSLKIHLTRVLYRVWSMHARTRRQTDDVKRRMTLGNCVTVISRKYSVPRLTVDWWYWSSPDLSVKVTPHMSVIVLWGLCQ